MTNCFAEYSALVDIVCHFSSDAEYSALDVSFKFCVPFGVTNGRVARGLGGGGVGASYGSGLLSIILRFISPAQGDRPFLPDLCGRKRE